MIYVSRGYDTDTMHTDRNAAAGYLLVFGLMCLSPCRSNIGYTCTSAVEILQEELKENNTTLTPCVLDAYMDNVSEVIYLLDSQHEDLLELCYWGDKLQGVLSQYIVLDDNTTEANVKVRYANYASHDRHGIVLYVIWCGKQLRGLAANLVKTIEDRRIGQPVAGQYLLFTISYNCTLESKQESGLTSSTCSGELQVKSRSHEYIPTNPLSGQHLRVAINLWPPFITETHENGTQVYRGLCIDILEWLALHLNFTYSLVLPADGEWGSEVNGSWNGLVGLMERREADMVVAPLTNTWMRQQVMDFSTYAFVIDTKTVLFRAPTTTGSLSGTLFRPFQWVVWLCIICAMVLVAFATSVFLMTSNTIGRSGSTKSKSALETLWVAGKVILRQNITSSEMFCSMPCKPVLIGAWLFMIIICATYSAKFVALLSVPKLHLPFNTVEEMATQTQYKYGFLGGGVYVEQLRDANLSLYQKLWRNIKTFEKTDPDVMSKNHTLLMQKVQRENFGYIMDSFYADYEIARNCGLTKLKKSFSSVQMTSIGLQKNSPYLHTVDLAMAFIIDQGLLQKWLSNYLKQVQVRCPVQPHVVKLGLEHTTDFFCVQIATLLIAVSVLLVECVYWRTCLS